MSTPPDPLEPSADDRLAKLKQSIAHETSQRAETAASGAGGETARGNSLAMSTGFRVASELVANVCVGGPHRLAIGQMDRMEPDFIAGFFAFGGSVRLLECVSDRHAADQAAQLNRCDEGASRPYVTPGSVSVARGIEAKRGKSSSGGSTGYRSDPSVPDLSGL